MHVLIRMSQDFGLVMSVLACILHCCLISIVYFGYFCLSGGDTRGLHLSIGRQRQMGIRDRCVCVCGRACVRACACMYVMFVYTYIEREGERASERASESERESV